MSLGMTGCVAVSDYSFTLPSDSQTTLINRAAVTTGNSFYCPTPIGLADTLIYAPPQDNLIITGTVTPNVATPSQFWCIGVHGGSGPSYGTTVASLGPNYGFGITPAGVTGFYNISIYDLDYISVHTYALYTTIPAPAAHTSATYYIHFTESSISYYWNGQLLYVNTAPSYYGPTLHAPSVFSIYGALENVGSIMTVSAGYSNQYPIYATPATSGSVTITATTITQQLTLSSPPSYCYTPQTFPTCYLTCNANFANYASQFIGLSSTGPTGNNYGFTYYTDTHLYVSLSGVNVLDLGIPTYPGTGTWATTPSLPLGLELTSSGVVFYYNGAVVYAAPTIAGNYQGVFHLTTVNDYVTNIDYGYFSGAGNIPLYANWTWATTGTTWYDNTGANVTNFTTVPYAYLDPTSGTANARNNFTLTEPTVLGQMKVPVSGTYLLQWTLDTSGFGGQYYMFISLNDGANDDVSSGASYVVANTNGSDICCISATVKILTSDYFNIGVDMITASAGTPSNPSGSFTISYLCA